MLPVEFCRQSKNNSITLVVTAGVPSLVTLWAELAVRDITEARQVLAWREGRSTQASLGITGFWTSSNSNGPCAPQVAEWADTHKLDGAVWTALGPKFCGVDGRVPTAQEVVAHLASLRGRELQDAERYVRRAPAQIRTNYRREIEEQLGWFPAG